MATTRNDNHLSEQFVGWETFLKNHHSVGGEAFRNRNALEWFCRCHRNTLIASGQLVPRSGRAGTLYGPLFTKVALDILRDTQLTAMQYMTVKGSQNSP